MIISFNVKFIPVEIDYLIDIITTSYRRHAWNDVEIMFKSRWNYDVETNFIWNLFSTSFQRQFAIFQRRFNVETMSLCMLGELLMI